MILPHEHIFVDLRTPDQEGYAQADVTDVVALMSPELERIKPLGISALVECTPTGVGRRVDLVKAVSQAADFPVVVATGIYREPWIPEWGYAWGEDQLYEWMHRELTDEIEQTGVQAAWIKLSAGDDGITETETKILRAASRAAKDTNAIIGSHTIRGRVVKDQLDVIERMGYTPSRYIWIHTQAEPDFALHLEMGRRGVWLEYDNFGWDTAGENRLIEQIQRLLDAGFGNQLLLSHDRGWYDPAKPKGGTPQPFTYLSGVILPKLRAVGLDDATIHQLTQVNPFKCYAR
jgi:phosphotriesterase-related protein